MKKNKPAAIKKKRRATRKIIRAKRGRPSIFTPEIAKRICDRLSDGESLRSICRDSDMPDEKTVRLWALDNVGKSEEYEGFFPHYARAREIAYLGIGDEIKDISDTPQLGEKRKIKADGEEIIIGDMIEHRKLQIDARKWILSKMLPKIFGDKLDLNVLNGPTVKTVNPDSLSAEQAEELYQDAVK